MNYLATVSNRVASEFAVPRSAARLVWGPWLGGLESGEGSEYL